MSQGEGWVDAAMLPFVGMLPAPEYNAIYSAVQELGEDKGRRLIRAILLLVQRVRRGA